MKKPKNYIHQLMIHMMFVGNRRQQLSDLAPGVEKSRKLDSVCAGLRT